MGFRQLHLSLASVWPGSWCRWWQSVAGWGEIGLKAKSFSSVERLKGIPWKCKENILPGKTSPGSFSCGVRACSREWWWLLSVLAGAGGVNSLAGRISRSVHPCVFDGPGLAPGKKVRPKCASLAHCAFPWFWARAVDHPGLIQGCQGWWGVTAGAWGGCSCEGLRLMLGSE